MGQVIEIKCNQCGYSEKFYLGMGMRDCDKKLLKNILLATRLRNYWIVVITGILIGSLQNVTLVKGY